MRTPQEAIERAREILARRIEEPPQATEPTQADVDAVLAELRRDKKSFVGRQWPK